MTWGNPPTSRRRTNPNRGLDDLTNEEREGLTTLSNQGMTPEQIRALDRHQQGAVENERTQDTAKWGYNPSGSIGQRAQDNVDLEYNERLRALERASGRSQRAFQQAHDTEQTYGREADQRVQSIYGALQNSLGQNRDQTYANYGNALDRIRQYYDEARGANQGVNEQVTGRMSEMAQRLGLEQALPESTKNIQGDYQFMQGQNANAKAGRSANLLTLAENIRALDNQRVGAAGREGAQQRAGITNEVLRTLGELGISGMNEQGEYSGQIAGLEGDKAAALRQELSRLTGEDWERGRQGRLDALQEMLGLSGLDLEKGRHRADIHRDKRNFENAVYSEDRAFDRGIFESNRGFDRGVHESDRNFGENQRQFDTNFNENRRQFDTSFGENRRQFDANYSIQLGQLENDALKIQAEIDAATDPTEIAIKEAKLNQINADIARTLADQKRIEGETARGGKKPGQYAQGDLDSFFNEPRPEWGRAAGPKFRGAATAVINEANRRAMESGEIGVGGRAADPYAIAMQIMDDPSDPYHPPKSQNRNLLRIAALIAFKGIK